MKSKEQKRIEAEARQAKYDALTNVEKWALINSRPGVSGKETTRFLEA